MTHGGTVGGIVWHRVVETEGPEFAPGFLLPDASPEALAPHRGWLEPRFLDPVSGKLVLAVQSYLLRTSRHVVLVDSCVGNGKERRFHAPWSRRASPAWLDRLAAHGAAPEDVDFVLCTHLHADHVGWNTRLVDGRWTPTFPNARYVFARTELEYWLALNEKGRKYSDGCIDDSVLPVIEAGQAEIVADDHALDDEIRLRPSPGHTPGHVCIELASGGRRAVLSGDVCHTPLQCREPGWSAVGCADRARSAATRRAFLDAHCETDVLVMTAHFPSPSTGYVRRMGEAFDFVLE